MADNPKTVPAKSWPASASGCQIKIDLLEKNVCGRTIHHAPSEIDEEPACLMHTRDTAKQSGPLFKEFWREFESILKDAGTGHAYFKKFVFPELSLKRTVQANCDFSNATFMQRVDFNNVIFAQDVKFKSAVFCQNTSFNKTTFFGNADFRLSVFAEKANFGWAAFTQNANFFKATFTKSANFSSTTFLGTTVWMKCRFLTSVVFRQTSFASANVQEPSAVFVLARFFNPDDVVFEGVDLSRALFYNCDVSKLRFLPSVRWGREGRRKGIIFEEKISTKSQYAKLFLEENGKRNHAAIAQIYQQLKKNYDSQLDYWTANEFHFGEMEMQRLSARNPGSFFRLRSWWRPRMSLIAWYRWVSDYGNSFGKALGWLFGLLFFFALLYPLPGLGIQKVDSHLIQNFASEWHPATPWPHSIQQESLLLLRSLVVSADTAMFQKNAIYAPASEVAHALADIEVLLISTVFALFLLAIRRRFRR